jgi:hypothetical protein
MNSPDDPTPEQRYALTYMSQLNLDDRLLRDLRSELLDLGNPEPLVNRLLVLAFWVGWRQGLIVNDQHDGVWPDGSVFSSDHPEIPPNGGGSEYGKT